MIACSRSLASPLQSSSGAEVAFVAISPAGASLQVVDVLGGPEVTVIPSLAPCHPNGGGSFCWSAESEEIFYVDTAGDLMAISSSGGRARRLVKGSIGKIWSPSASPDGLWVAFTVDDHELGVVSTAGGSWPIQVATSSDFVIDPSWAPDSSALAWHEWSYPHMPWDQSEILVAIFGAQGPSAAPVSRRVVAGGSEISVQQPRFAPAGTAMSFLTDVSGWLNLWSVGAIGELPVPLLTEHVEHGEPTWGAGQRSFAWSSDGQRILFTRNSDAGGSLDLLTLPDPDKEDAVAAVQGIDSGVFRSLDWVGSHAVGLHSTVTTPSQLVSIDTTVGTHRSLAVGPISGFAGVAAEPRNVSYTSGKAKIVGRLYTPDGPISVPLMVLIHGGPTGQRRNEFDMGVSFWLDRGWAVFVPDYRGSTGHGRGHTDSLKGKWGDVDVEDVAAGIKFLSEEGLCDGSRVVVNGTSAGGFTAMNLMAKYPELVKGGISISGVADLFSLVDSEDRFERRYVDSLVGTLPGARDLFESRSPISVADRITKPLLVIHGTKDKAVPFAQSVELVNRINSTGGNAELIALEGEGHHGFSATSAIRVYEECEKFVLVNHLS